MVPIVGVGTFFMLIDADRICIMDTINLSANVVRRLFDVGI